MSVGDREFTRIFDGLPRERILSRSMMAHEPIHELGQRHGRDGDEKHEAGRAPTRSTMPRVGGRMLLRNCCGQGAGGANVAVKVLPGPGMMRFRMGVTSAPQPVNFGTV